METLAVHRSSKLITPFSVYFPESSQDALLLSETHRNQCCYMAGGVSLINEMKAGAKYLHVISLTKLPRFRTIESTKEGVRIGAGVTLWHLQTSAQNDLPPQLSGIMAQIGNVRVRMKATVGGNIMARDKNFDLWPVMTALNAHLEFARSNAEPRSVPIGNCDLADAAGRGELLTAVKLPKRGLTWIGYDRTLRPAITIAVGVDVIGSSVTDVRVGIACAYSQPMCSRIELGEPVSLSALRGKVKSMTAGWTEGLPPPSADAYGTSAYRRHIASVLVRRQLEQFVEALEQRAVK